MVLIVAYLDWFGKIFLKVAACCRPSLLLHARWTRFGRTFLRRSHENSMWSQVLESRQLLGEVYKKSGDYIVAARLHHMEGRWSIFHVMTISFPKYHFGDCPIAPSTEAGYEVSAPAVPGFTSSQLRWCALRVVSLGLVQNFSGSLTFWKCQKLLYSPKLRFKLITAPIFNTNSLSLCCGQLRIL